MCMYTSKRLYSVLASFAPFKERFRAAAGCNAKNAYVSLYLFTHAMHKKHIFN